jgi:16S rRNA (uracil1498-N3)-methyltransferase
MRTPRLFADMPLKGGPVELTGDAARHAQVLRLQPGHELAVFDGVGGEWHARVGDMRRDAVVIELMEHHPTEREAGVAVTLAVVMPTNDRMDTLVEKACELGAVAIQPLMSERSVLRLDNPERAARRVAHWRAVAVAACTQCGRNWVMQVAEVAPLEDWLADLSFAEASTDANAAGIGLGPKRWLLSTRVPASSALPAAPTGALVTLLSGPEGGFTEREEALAVSRGFAPLSLGARVMRADTAPLAALAALVLGTSR